MWRNPAALTATIARSLGRRRTEPPSERTGRLPDFLIIGAQRCGTTSLYRYLVQHPGVSPATWKEVHFFDKRYRAGLDWYAAQFDDRPGTLAGEATPYYLFHPHAARRAAEAVPDAKLIVLLRNPVDRAWSQYHMSIRQRRERLGFEQALEREPERLAGQVEQMLADEHYLSPRHQHFSYLSRGIYVDQLRTWRSFFPSERMLVLRSEDLYADPLSATNRVAEFLGLKPWDGFDFRRYNNGHLDPMPPDTRRRLEKYFREPNARLRELLGADGARFHWS